MQCETALLHYLKELHALSMELSMSTMLVEVTPELHALADAANDNNPHRQDEAYRRAVAGIYAHSGSLESAYICAPANIRLLPMPSLTPVLKICCAT